MKMERFFRLRNEGGSLRVDGASVRRARWEARLTQAELADRVGLLGYYLPQPYVSKLERGEYRWGFTERMATALAAALGVGISQITDGPLLTIADAQRIRELVGQLGEVLEPGSRPGIQSQTA
jgi:transcriptional regulator with XRE-family HTH domain